MKFLYCLVVFTLIHSASAFSCSELLAVQDSTGNKKESAPESDQKLLRFKLKTSPMFNSSLPGTDVIPDNLVIDTLQISDPVVLNILDEYFQNKLKKTSQSTYEEMLFTLDKSRTEELLQALSLSYKPDPPAVAVLRKYLGASRNTAAIILLIIHLAKF